VSEILFGSDGVPVKFGIPIGDLVLGGPGQQSDGSGTANEINKIYPNGGVNEDVTNGFCTTVAASSVDSSHTCAPSPGIAPISVALNIGITPAGAPLSSPLADATGASGQFNISLADFPPGAAGGDPGTGQTYTVPAFNLTAKAGDQSVSLQNATQAVNDVIPVTGVVVVADTGNNQLTLGSPVQRNLVGNLGGPGTYNITGLQNDQQWCFTVADVNVAGFPTMGATWGAGGVFASPNVCATPSQIDGFLNRSTCFIATAAYGDEWDPRLETLRQFRDQVLDAFAPGRAFVDWYYSWSPGAAHWLMANPSYKAIVRVVLLPLVEAARMALWMR
jgi:hypothetical protein